MTSRPCRRHPSKRLFRSQEEANDAARHVRRKARHLIRAYECFSCGGFHLTKKQARP